MKPIVLSIFGLFSIVAGFVLNLIIPELKAYTLIILGIGVILLVLSVVIDFKQIKKTMGTQRGRLGLSLSVRVICACAAAILFNSISFEVFHRFDFTGVSQYTLTSQTRETIGELDEPVEVVGFFSSSVSTSVIDYAQSLLEEYQIYTDELSVEFIDPELNPDIARKYQMESFETYYGVLIFKGSAGEKRVYGPQVEEEAEHAFTSAIMEVSGNKQKMLYFTYGHGESVSDSALSILQDNLYAVDEVNLADTGAVPEDAAALIISGPMSDFAESETKALESYMQEGGCLLVMLNPGYNGGLSDFLQTQSMKIDEGVIVDPSSYVVPRMNVLLVDENRNLFSLSKLFFPDAAAVVPLQDLPEGRVLVPLVWSKEDSWVDTDEADIEEFTYNSETDEKGTFAVGLVAYNEQDTSGSRIAVLGDSDFITESNILNGNNANFFLLLTSWLTEGKDVVELERNVLPYRRLIMSSEQARFMTITSIGLIPLLLLISGIYIWWRKR